MKTLQKGENVALSTIGLAGNCLFASLDLNAESESGIDISAFLLGENGTVVHDNDFIFYNQPQDLSKSISLIENKSNKNSLGKFSIKINAIPEYIKKIVFVATINNQANFSSVNGLTIKLGDQKNNDNLICFTLDSFGTETAIAVGELYLHQSNWKFRALGNGFESGLSAFANDFGLSLSNIDFKKSSDPDNALIENEAKIAKQIKKMLPQIKSAVHQGLNESNTRMILDKFFIEVLGYKMKEIKNEVKIQGRKADYVFAVGNDDVLVVEAKKAGMALKDDQIFQATSYAAYAGMKYVLLTNLCEFILFRVKTDGIVDYDAIFSIDLLSDFDIKDIKKLALISRYGMTKPELLEILCEQSMAAGVENVARILLDSEVLDTIKNIIKRENNCDVTHEQIQESIDFFINTTLAVY